MGVSMVRRNALERGTALKILYCLALVVIAAACQPSSPRSTKPTSGLAEIQAPCGQCHALGRLGDSPNPIAPPFAAIANQPNLTAETLSAWLRDAHNYPDQMSFSLSEAQTQRLVAYMLTLRDPEYRPSP
jgi:mono/diheme cytochrome c family protein